MTWDYTGQKTMHSPVVGVIPPVGGTFKRHSGRFPLPFWGFPLPFRPFRPDSCTIPSRFCRNSTHIYVVHLFRACCAVVHLGELDTRAQRNDVVESYEQEQCSVRSCSGLVHTISRVLDCELLCHARSRVEK
jgi:hypothetical protein